MKRGEIWDIDLPLPPGGSGREQTGFRPAIILNVKPDPGNILCVVLLTSQIKALRFSHTVRIQPSGRNGLTKESVALVYQLTAVDRTRFVRRRGELEAASMAELESTIRSLLGL